MRYFLALLMNLVLALMPVCVSAESIRLNQLIQKVIDHYPSLKVAAIQVERARQENIKIENQLAWQLAAKGGISRNMSLFGTPTDRVDVSGNLKRALESGAALSFNAAINREDATTTLSPLQPNPSTISKLDISYRHPLAKGANNPAYTQAKEIADANKVISHADQQNRHDQLASQIIELYMAGITTHARITNTQQAIKRSQRLQAYIKDRSVMGLSEEKDVLQVKAQLSRQQAEYQGLKVIWEQQRISLNRLMGRDWAAPLELALDDNLQIPEQLHDELYQQVKARSPELVKVDQQLKLADAAIKLSRDAKKDGMDLLMYLGNQTYSGDTAAGSQSESEVFAGVSVEYNRGLDKSGYDAEIYQAQLDRGIALQNKKQIMEDLYYELSSLLAEIKANNMAVKAYKVSVNSEHKKLQEAEQRYKSGRTDTDQLIQFESQLSQAKLSYELQKIELNRRYHSLSLLRGLLWKNIKLPEYSFTEAGE
ncbi:MAG: TolC family protein [Gammaproteobacteria bacterium]|nr:TolC family protein [Gammaproteobacteria bacterium]MCW8909615.1 TolC family protein [Gammaproteobacteria bacterium]MCW9055310.1 TolC family protein [Gammaproteobacteria bacterium]